MKEQSKNNCDFFFNFIISVRDGHCDYFAPGEKKKLAVPLVIIILLYYCLNIMTNNQIHSFHTRYKTNLHQPTANLTKYQKGVYYSGVKIFNNLPKEIKDLTNQPTSFRNALKRFLLLNCFYNREECFNYQTQ